MSSPRGRRRSSRRGGWLRPRLEDSTSGDWKRSHGEELPAGADLVCYWFEKAGRQIASGKAARAGLVATNSIRGGWNLPALQVATSSHRIFEAWSDEPCVNDGAAVRVSLICFSHNDDDSVSQSRLNGQLVHEIYSDLTAPRDTTGVDLTRARSLPANRRVAFVADQKGGPFDVPGDQAREWLVLPVNPNGRPNVDVLKPWVNGMDLTRRPAGKWIVDFGWTMSMPRSTRSRFGGLGRTSTQCAAPAGVRLIASAGGGTLTRDRACGARSMGCHATLPHRPLPSTGCLSGATSASAQTIN